MGMQTRYSRRSWRTRQTRVTLMLLVLAVAGCSIRLISSYDEITDRSATELQRKVERFVRSMESASGTAAGAYANNTAFYDEAKADVSAMRIRATAIPQNRLTLQQIELLDRNLELLRQLHQRGDSLRAAVATPALDAMNATFAAIIKLELEKKRGAAK
jgi:hypothetical protein